MKTKFIVAQLGARMHYAVPRILHQAGMLAHFYTDICSTKGLGRLTAKLPAEILPKSLKRLQARVPEGVPANRITTFDALGSRYAIKRMRARTGAEMTRTHLWAGRGFAHNVIIKGVKDANGIYTFNGTGLELLRHAKAQGLFAVMEQTQAPISIWKQLMAVEQQRYPEWENPKAENTYHEVMDERNKDEWRQSDLIICASEYTKKCMCKAGAPIERCLVVPYGVDSRFEGPPKTMPTGPLKVLTVGTVNLNKGSPYVLEAAKQLKGKAVFRMVGGVQVSQKARNELVKHVELTGLVPRSEVPKHYAWADVFLFPSICDGFGVVLIEALSARLPVITTANTGVAIREGIEGFIIPIRKVEPIVEAVIRLSESRTLWQDMSQAAKARSREFTLAAYQERLLAALTKLFSKANL